MIVRSYSRRCFLARSAALSAAAVASPWAACFADDKQKLEQRDWLAMLEDPVRKMFPGKPDLDKILKLYPRTTGPAAFHAKFIADGIANLKTTPEVNTGHPFLDLSVKTGLVYINATFIGDHPKYGVGHYAQTWHDGFPPTIIAAVDALSDWGLSTRAAELFRYWLHAFVRENGTMKYPWPSDINHGGAPFSWASVAEYGQLLHTAALLEERTGPDGWWTDSFKSLDAIAENLLQLRAESMKTDGLLVGVPEADIKHQAKYFHNSAWAAKGLRRWADLCDRQKAAPKTSADTARKIADDIAADTLRAIRKTWPADPKDWWLPPCVEPQPRPACLTGNTEASYTNYRYWPELLSSGILPADMANRIVEARLSAGGQFCGMTRFAGHLDDWPLADYLYGLWSLGRKNDFLLSLYGHIAYHQAEGHLTAYEQVSFPPGKKVADYCLPCQLVAARAARLLVK